MLTRYGVLSDVHANWPALDACLEALSERGAERYVCCGDIVGYYAHTNEVVERLRGLEIYAIAGNHDRCVSSGERFPNPYAAAGVDYAVRSLTNENKDWLAGLPAERIETLDGFRVGIFHGSPFDPDRYVFEPQVTPRYVTQRQLDVAIMGHTHHPYVKRFREGLVLNPGSTGQPRDGDPKAACALLDLNGGGTKAEILRVEYDLDPVVTDSLNAGLPGANVRRLFRGI